MESSKRWTQYNTGLQTNITEILIQSKSWEGKERMNKTIATLLVFVVVTTTCQPAGKKVSQELTKPDENAAVKPEDVQAETNLAAAPEIEAMYKQLMESQD